MAAARPRHYHGPAGSRGAGGEVSDGMLKKISIGCGGCLVLLGLAIGVLWFLGSNVPREHTVASRIELSRSPADVWLDGADVEGQASWAKGIDDVDKTTTADGHELFIQYSPFGEIPFVVVENEPHRRFTTEVYRLPNDWGGSWSWELSPTADGCTVTLTEEGWDDNALRRFFAEHLVGQHLAIDMILASLSRELGEEQVPIHLE